jgi:hypothetical protein
MTIRSMPANDNFRDGWERLWGGKLKQFASDEAELMREAMYEGSPTFELLKPRPDLVGTIHTPPLFTKAGDIAHRYPFVTTKPRE